ncbi:caspase family protein [uncultured Spirosoma sp.]|uniref:caspase family protein n=1 Tax=uncultured Spirosoma sp. TaxID=278208 RepID=UPI0025843151|nr:caspase family protein [uncultured Spirosoma sp.]
MLNHIHFVFAKIVSILLTGWLSLNLLPSSAQTTYAVIAGVSDYLNAGPTNGDLQYADDDALLFAQLLQTPAGGNVPAQNIVLLTNHQATRDNIRRAMTLFRRAAPNDRIIFFFSGHGDQGVLLPYDVGPGVVLLHNDVKQAFRQSAARTKLLLADACKSGSMRRRTTQLQAPAPSSSTLNKNVIVMMSSRSNQFSQELRQLQHGAFTYFLVRGVQGEADIDRNRVITMQELYAYMRTKIGRLTAGKQIPVVFGRFPASMPFAYL